MTVTPQGDLYLCKTKLENDYKNQLTWDNINTQETYFNGTVQNTFSEYTYMKKDSTVTVGANIDSIIDCNYLFYINNGFTNKRYYCFITKMEYVNENTTRITFETDCFQTWYFELQYNNCFVEREHVNDDTIGLHTIPEGLETGDYIVNDISKIDLGLKWYVVGCTKKYDSNWARGGGIYNGIYSGKTYYAVRTTADVDGLIQEYDSAGYGDDIAELFIVPAKLIGNPTYQPSSPVYKVPQSALVQNVENITLSRPTSLNNYTPKNKKLLVYPFQYLLVDNNGGGSSDYHYELFTNPNNCQFSVIGALTPGTSMTLLPIEYLNSNSNKLSQNLLNYGIPLAKFPTCNWNTDLYVNWATQNAVNMTYGPYINMAQGFIGGTSKGDLLGGATSGAISGLNTITNNLMERYAKSFSPNQSKGNANSGDVITSCNANAPHFYKMSIKQEYAKIIDEYFDMFGYKVNDVKIPNITGRRNWNYVKTIDCNVDGDIPQTDLNIIKTMFNNGVTLWHNPANIYNYSLDNSII